MATAEPAYSERPSRIPGAVVWRRVVRQSGQSRILPDGCMDLIWVDGVLLVAGPDTTAHLTWSPAGLRCAAVRFAPGTAPAQLGVPAEELRDQRVALSALWSDRRVRLLADHLSAAAEPGQALESALLANAVPPEPWVGAVVARARAGVQIGAIAAEVGLSERQLHRRCLSHFGYGLKTLSRVLRVNEAVDLARGGMAFGAVAVAAGYADQAHLAREVKSLVGVPLGVFVG